MKSVALGLIGYGAIGHAHLRSAMESPLIDVVAVADLREEARKEAAKTCEAAKVYEQGVDLIDDSQVEAVVLAMPTCGRTGLALHAFARGKHVLTEKPVAMNADEVKRMVEARGDLVAGCCSSRTRFLQSASVATRFIATGALGDLRVLRVRGISAAGPKPEKTPPAWRLSKALNGGGIMVNWGCYDLDYMLGLAGWSLKPELVLAQTWEVPPQFESHIAPGSDAETHVTALVRCAGGTVITYERGEYMAAQTEDAWEIAGSKGSLHLWMIPEEGKKMIYDSTTTEKGVVSEVLWEGEEEVSIIHREPVRDFAAAILEGRQPKTSLEQALVVQEITDAIYASAERGVAVAVD